MNKKVLIIIIIIISIIIIGNILINYNVQKNKVTGDQFKFIAEKDGWIYLLKSENMIDNIYKMKQDRTNVTKLIDDNCNSVLLDQKYLYYTNDSDKGSLYKVETDGTQRVKLEERKSKIVKVFQDNIYYVVMDENRAAGYLFRMNKDGTNKIQISEDLTANIQIEKDWIYYTTSSGVSKLYRINHDGKEKIMLSDGNVNSFAIEKDWIYYNNNQYDYASGKNSKENGIFKIKSDGTQRTQLKSYINELGQMERPQNIILKDDWIYYVYNYFIFKLSKDGGNPIEICDKVCSWPHDKMYCNTLDIEPKAKTFEIYNDWIYYRMPEYACLYRINVNQQVREQLTDSYVTDYTISDGRIYYISDGLIRMNLDGSEKEGIKEINIK